MQLLENNSLLNRETIVWLSFSFIFSVLSLLPIVLFSYRDPWYECSTRPQCRRKASDQYERRARGQSRSDSAPLGSLLVNNSYHINYVTGESPTRKIKREVKQKSKEFVKDNYQTFIILKDPNGNSLDKLNPYRIFFLLLLPFYRIM